MQHSNVWLTLAILWNVQKGRVSALKVTHCVKFRLSSLYLTITVFVPYALFCGLAASVQLIVVLRPTNPRATVTQDDAAAAID